MVKRVLLLVFLAFTTVMSVSVRENQAIRRQSCSRGDKIVNDCNWCYCRNSEFVCQARDCRSVDVFGHFNDAIQDIKVGMEGHGTWRTPETACEPHVHYRRGPVLCVCGEDGVWPNPACRDIFRVLYKVESTTENDTCSPFKLYYDKCNICVCPSEGRIDPKQCYNVLCRSGDPGIDDSTDRQVKTDIDSNEIEEVYAQCNVDDEYQLECRTCRCLRNNRLLCGNCTKSIEDEQHYCKTMPAHAIFSVECNLCFCDESHRLICSAKRCLGTVAKDTRRRLMDIDERYFELVNRPIDLHTCKTGTKYRKGCNTCICLEHETGPMFACSVRRCKEDESLVRTIREGCVLHTTYVLNCLKCSCVMANNKKWQWCETDNVCLDGTGSSKDLSAMNGYCEPLHSYMSDCNRCQCLSDGQTVVCSDMKCDKSGIAVEIVPILQRGYDCPRGQAYKLDCNICYCLLNGNSLCTTLDCEQKQVN